MGAMNRDNPTHGNEETRILVRYPVTPVTCPDHRFGDRGICFTCGQPRTATMNAWEQSLSTLGNILRAGDGHYLAAVLKLCATEILSRQLPGHQLVYDVAYQIHDVTSAERVADAVARYYAGPTTEHLPPSS